MTPRERFEHLLSSQIAFVQRHGEYVALLLFAVDGFDAIADRWGSAAGETVVTALARRVASALAVEDRVHRYEGHKLAVVRRVPVPNQAVALAERLRTRVANTPVAIPQARDALFVTVSIGLAIFPSPQLTGPSDVFAGAVAALRRAARSGGNRVCLAAPGYRPSTLRMS